MFLKVYDDTGDYIHVMDNDVPNVIVNALCTFDFFAEHIRILSDRVDYILRKDYIVGITNGGMRYLLIVDWMIR
jgi:hypothetical protein